MKETEKLSDKMPKSYPSYTSIKAIANAILRGSEHDGMDKITEDAKTHLSVVDTA